MRQLVVLLAVTASACFAPVGEGASALSSMASTADAGPSASCPTAWPPQRCSVEGQFCAYGTESCCGRRWDSVICTCRGGMLECMYTDACLSPNCPDGG